MEVDAEGGDLADVEVLPWCLLSGDVVVLVYDGAEVTSEVVPLMATLVTTQVDAMVP